MAVLFPGCFVCVCVCEPKNYFLKKNFKRKAPDYCFLLGMERGVDQKAHCVLFKVLSHWTLRLQVWKKKKSHWNMCDWLFFAWHLVVTWKNCSFDLWEGAPWETTGKRKGFGFVLCIHRNLNGSPRTDPGNLEGGLWTQSLPIIWFPVMLQERPKSRRQKNVFSYLLF